MSRFVRIGTVTKLSYKAYVSSNVLLHGFNKSIYLEPAYGKPLSLNNLQAVNGFLYKMFTPGQS